MLLDKTITELAALLRSKEISSVDLISESINSIKKLNSELNMFISVKEEKKLLEEAKKADKSRNSDSHILHGIPFSMKDAYVTKDLPTTAGSKVLDGFMSPYDATVCQKLKDCGAILIGKNNQDAWGHGGSTENTDYKTARNPWNPDYITGGSSGGSAASVSTRTAAFSIGEDTGGSIRNPSSICGVSGLKVSYGRVSRYGAIAYASSLDTVGPIAKNVEDLAILLQAIAGKDHLDATSSSLPIENYQETLSNSLSGKTIGIPKEFFVDGIDEEVKKTIFEAIKKFESIGVKTKEISLPYIKFGVAIYYLIALSETSSNLARYDGIRYGNDRDLFSDETKRRIIIGTYALSVGHANELYKKAQKARTSLIKQYNDAFKKCDVIIAPVTPSLTPKIGELIGDPLKNLLEDIYTVTVNVVGSPSLAIPAGFSSKNMPIGMQLIGERFKEAEILNFGYQYQKITDWHKQKPIINLKK